MADYVYINDINKKGTMAISKTVFNSIAYFALNRIGIKVSEKGTKKRLKARLYNPIETTIHHGIVHVSVNVDIKKGTDIQDITSKIQNEITTAFLCATEHIPFDIQVKTHAII